MGCRCSGSNNDYISEILNERQGKENDSITNNGDLIMNIEEEKKNLVQNLSLKGQFLDEDINTFIESIEPNFNTFETPNEIKERINKSNIIKLPLIKMNDGNIYEGSWNLDGKKEGYGIYINTNKYIYKGLWKNGCFDEYGFLFNNKDNYYIGEFIDGIAKGKGELIINNKIKYIGEFDNNLPNGKGNIIYLEDQMNYTGDIINGYKDGFGILEFKDGTKYEGEFKEDKYNGKGKIIYSDNSEYEGNFFNNLKDGKGIFKWPDGKVYEGEFKKDKKHGKGKFIFKKNQFYEGNWINDLTHGKGLYNINGKIFPGIFKYGKMIIDKKNDNLKK